MYGLTRKMTALDGQRDALMAILKEGTTKLPGCLIYEITSDPMEPNAVWINEVWQSREIHKMSLKSPVVRQTIERGRPLIADIGEAFETLPGIGCGFFE